MTDTTPPLMNRPWNILPPPPESFEKEFPELSKTVLGLLYNRNIRTQERIDEFLNPEYSKNVHDPFLFQHMTRAVERIFDAIEKKEKIIIYGDYDADGVSASVILTDTLFALGATELNVYLPHRELDGYGLNKKAVNYLHEQDTKLLITCDCGISNAEEVALANTLGMDVIITDHHSIPAVIPEAYAIIHPKIENEPYPDKHLAGGGVAFKLAQALLRTHAKSHSVLANGESHDGFEKWLLDMVAIASVADMVPLLGESRTLTKYGLLVLNKTRRIGLVKMLEESGLFQRDEKVPKPITARSIGFVIAPRINAAGRLDHANVAYKLLVSERADKAQELAWELERNNNERRELTTAYVAEAVRQVETNQKDEPVLFVHHPEWKTGIVGLIASRIKDQYQKPTIALAYNGDILTGSGRSITGFNLIGALQQMPHYFHKFGGHPMACGFSLADATKRDEFQQTLRDFFRTETGGKDMTPPLDIDTEITLDQINWELYDVLEKFEPFGQQNEKPSYVAKQLTVVKVETLGKDGAHLKLMVTQGTNPILKKFVGWQLCGDTAKGEDWCTVLQPGDMVDVVFDIGVNEWNGNRELQLTIVDIKKHT